jgi:hypothetical protein
MTAPHRDAGLSRRLLLLPLAALLAISCTLPEPCAAGKWITFTNHQASLSLLDRLSPDAANTLSVTQSLPVNAPKELPDNGMTLSLSGTLLVPSNGTEPLRLFVSGYKFTPLPLPTSVKPAITSKDYQSLSGKASLTASLKDVNIEGCPDTADCVPMLLDLEWVTKGERLSASESDSRFINIDYRTKPPSRLGNIYKGRGAQYLSRDVARLRVRRVTPEGNEEVVLEATFSCKNQENCTFDLFNNPSRSYSRGP